MNYSYFKVMSVLLLEIVTSIVVMCGMSNVYAMRQPLRDKHRLQRNKKIRSDDNQLIQQIDTLLLDARRALFYRQKSNLLKLQQDQELIEHNLQCQHVSYKVKRNFTLAKSTIKKIEQLPQAYFDEKNAQPMDVVERGRSMRRKDRSEKATEIDRMRKKHARSSEDKEDKRVGEINRFAQCELWFLHEQAENIHARIAGKIERDEMINESDEEELFALENLIKDSTPARLFFSENPDDIENFFKSINISDQEEQEAIGMTIVFVQEAREMIKTGKLPEFYGFE